MESDNQIPLSSISQWTDVYGMMASSPLSLRTMRVRWATQEVSQHLFGSSPAGHTDPRGRHMRHKGDICLSLRGILRPRASRSYHEIVIDHV